MKLREVLRAIDDFQYIVNEYDVSSNGTYSVKKINIYCRETSMRRLQVTLHHEILVKGKWHILTKDEFIHLRGTGKTKTIVRKSFQAAAKIFKKEVTPLDRVILTDHFCKRAEERFGVTRENMKKFLTNIFDDHFIVQGAEFYNTIRDHGPTDLYLCSIKHNTILVVKFVDSRYVLATLFPTKETKWFQNWFTDHMDKIQNLPTIGQFFRY